MQVRHKAELPGVEGYELWKVGKRKSVSELLSKLRGGGGSGVMRVDTQKWAGSGEKGPERRDGSLPTLYLRSPCSPLAISVQPSLPPESPDLCLSLVVWSQLEFATDWWDEYRVSPPRLKAPEGQGCLRNSPIYPRAYSRG